MHRRSAWMERELEVPCGDDLAGEGGPDDGARSGFWSAALRPGRRRIAWWSWRPGRECCGILEFGSRLGDGPCDAVDLSDAPVQRPRKDGAPPSGGVAKTLTLLSPEEIVLNGLLDRAEDVPLRMPTGDGGLVSAPLSFFDDALLRHTPCERWPTARAFGAVLCASLEGRLCPTGDHVLAARVRALAAGGWIEPRGGGLRTGMAGIEIRLAGRTTPPAGG